MILSGYNHGSLAIISTVHVCRPISPVIYRMFFIANVPSQRAAHIMLGSAWGRRVQGVNPISPSNGRGVYAIETSPMWSLIIDAVHRSANMDLGHLY
jgi:hypothetical protein